MIRHPGFVIFAFVAAACGDSDKGGSTADTTTATSTTDAATSDVATLPPEDPGLAQPDVTPRAGGPGDPCAEDTDCDGPAPVCLGLPGGYCAPSCAEAACPDGSVCYEFDGGELLCLASCGSNADCRGGEGHICDTDDTCWWYEGSSPGTSPIGGPCESDEDCKDAGASCYPEGFDGNANGFIGGYCMIFDCTTSCPDGSKCITVTSDGTKACFAECSVEVACPQAEGYMCASDTNTCWPGCEGDDDCPDGYGCSADVGGCVYGYSSEPFVCDDTRYEPNDVIGAAAEVSAPLSVTGLDLCADEDWYRVTFPQATLGTVGIDFAHIRGDLDLLVYDEDGEFLGSRVGPQSYGAQSRGYENSVEYHSIMNASEAAAGYFRVRGFNNAQNAYALTVSQTSWVDGLLCTDHFGFDACRGYTGEPEGELYQFPFPRADDPYVPNGYTLESYGQYRWLRRETMMLVRYAIHEVQQRFPDTDPLGLIDMCDKFGITPGFDVGDPRHPESTHDQGGNIDIAYYQTDGDSSGSVVCGPNESAHDGYFCTSVTNHVMDVPRTTYFIAQFNKHPRLRVIGVDKLLAPLIEAEAKKQRDAGWITTEVYQSLLGKLAYGDGWPFHHHHLHVSMRWWSQDAAQPNGLVVHPEPEIGCGYRRPGDGPWPRPEIRPTPR
ncbi:MAG: hypothetical protein IT385_12220 [Deltaproteobacteria bacterium]|nr:hypothetical protein [Deltaproteobacteria bacterium]